MDKKSKKKETSKVLLWLNYAVVILITSIIIYCTFNQIECGNLTTICGCAWVEIGAATGFYYTMCKRLNVPKVVMGIYSELPQELKDGVDINMLLSSLMN